MRNLFTGLYHHPDFMKLWMGQAISEFGSRITRDGLPLLAVLILNASPAQMGILSAISALPVLLFGLFAGVFVDRVRRRPIMIACDALRFVVLLTIPFAALTGTLTIGLVYAVAAVVAALALIFEIAYRAYLPTLIERDQIVEGNAKLGTTDALAEIGGPALTGVLVSALTAPIAILFDALSFLVSIMTVRAIHAPEPPPPTRDDEASAMRAVIQELVEGIRHTARDPILRTLAVGMGLRAFFGSFIGTLYDLYAVRVLGLSPFTLGLLVACGGIGALIGAAVAGWLPKRIGIGRAIAFALIVSGVINLAIPLASVDVRFAVPLMSAAQIIGDGAMMVYWVNETSLRQLRVPDCLMGRVNAGFGFLAQGIAPVGALGAGVIAGSIGAGSTLWIATLGILAVAIWISLSPLRRLDAIPLIMEGNST